MGRVLQEDDIALSNDKAFITCGPSSIIESKYVFAIMSEPESPNSQIYKVQVRFKTNQYVTLTMNEEALLKLKAFWQESSAHQLILTEKNKIENRKQRYNIKNIKIDFILLYFIISFWFICGFAGIIYVLNDIIKN